jgi:PRTRC genetic system protein B
VVPPDELKLRLDFYSQAIVMHVIEEGVIQNRIVSAEDISRTLARQIGVSSGLLPEGTLWWRQQPEGAQVAIWRRPQATRVALQEEMFQPADRYTLPMPGLLFLCSPGRPPWLWATKKRPTSPDDILYHAPCFNVFRKGESCPGTHRYGQDVGQIPEEFFTAFFTRAADSRVRSHKYPEDLKALWQELDGKRRFPTDDLVEYCRLKDIMANANFNSWR